MSLAVGTRFGQYEVLAPLGAGGMGEVYRARDLRLNRDVALKILPDAFTEDRDRVMRFEREAKTLASLNHPHIAQIYGFDGRALAMELVEGEDLSQMIVRGAVPLGEALAIARQIAEALEAAHEQGIIHRDLKPSNIKLRPDGAVKVLDFGLAKALTPDAPETAALVSQSPTITSPAMTAAGVILGTAAYMSPEQAKGRPADRRSDIWSFGCVLYEMLSGARPFRGEDVAETLAFILTKEPDWSALPDSVPAGIRTLLQRCLTKDRKRRLDSAAAARLDIDDELTKPIPGGTTVHEIRRRPATRTLASIALPVGVVAGWFAALWFTEAPASAPPVARLVANVSPAERLLGVTTDERRFLPNRPSRWAVAWAPDGSRFVFTAIRGDTQQLYLRSLADGLDAEPIPGTENSDTPFFSPDGQWLGFWRGNELRKMPASGGPSVRICATPPIFGASWGSNNFVVFGSERGDLMRVSADGGTPQQLTTAKESGDGDHRFPHVLPGGNEVLFTAVRGRGAAVVLLSVDTGKQTPLIEEGADARFVSSGHIVYAGRNATLMAAPFDLERRQVTGSPVGLVEDVMQALNAPSLPLNTWAAQFSISETGTLLYVPGGLYPQAARTLVWVDRAGAVEELRIDPKAYLSPRLSPDGQRVALFAADSGDIWIYDLGRGSLTLFESPGRAGSWPNWSRDGKRLAYQRSAGLFWKPVDGTGSAEMLSTFTGIPASWSPEGRLAISHPVGDDGARALRDWNISVVTPGDPKRTPQPVVHTPAMELYPDFSPDGHWLAYASNQSGRDEVSVQPYPGPGRQHPISINGGTQPRWARNGRELFFTVRDSAASTDFNTVMVVDVETSPVFKAGIPRPLRAAVRFTMPGHGYDVSADGQRFLTVRDTKTASAPPPSEMIVVLNWVEELKRRVPR